MSKWSMQKVLVFSYEGRNSLRCGEEDYKELGGWEFHIRIGKKKGESENN